MASMGIAIGTSTIVCYMVDVHYWECPLTEVPLYIHHVLWPLKSHYLKGD